MADKSKLEGLIRRYADFRIMASRGRATQGEVTGAWLEVIEAISVEQWQPIDTAPKDGRTLLFGYFNSHDKWRTLRGQWMSQEYIDDQWEEPDMGEPGWYETSVEADDVPNCWPTYPTHWQPLPPAPEKDNG